MTKREIQIFRSFDKRMKEGKEILTSYEPLSIMTEFIFNWNLTIKKDRRGNVIVKVMQRKKAKKKTKRKIGYMRNQYKKRRKKK